MQRIVMRTRRRILSGTKRYAEMGARTLCILSGTKRYAEMTVQIGRAAGRGREREMQRIVMRRRRRIMAGTMRYGGMRDPTLRSLSSTNLYAEKPVRALQRTGSRT